MWLCVNCIMCEIKWESDQIENNLMLQMFESLIWKRMGDILLIIVMKLFPYYINDGEIMGKIYFLIRESLTSIPIRWANILIKKAKIAVNPSEINRKYFLITLGGMSFDLRTWLHWVKEFFLSRLSARQRFQVIRLTQH